MNFIESIYTRYDDEEETIEGIQEGGMSCEFLHRRQESEVPKPMDVQIPLNSLHHGPLTPEFHSSASKSWYVSGLHLKEGMKEDKGNVERIQRSEAPDLIQGNNSPETTDIFYVIQKHPHVLEQISYLLLQEIPISTPTQFDSGVKICIIGLISLGKKHVSTHSPMVTCMEDIQDTIQTILPIHSISIQQVQLHPSMFLLGQHRTSMSTQLFTMILCGHVEVAFYQLFCTYMKQTWKQHSQLWEQIHTICTNKLYNALRKFQQLMEILSFWIQHQRCLVFQPINIVPLLPSNIDTWQPYQMAKTLCHCLQPPCIVFPKYNLINKQSNQTSYLMAWTQDILKKYDIVTKDHEIIEKTESTKISFQTKQANNNKDKEHTKTKDAETNVYYEHEQKNHTM
jgi:hypothetical protein